VSRLLALLVFLVAAAYLVHEHNRSSQEAQSPQTPLPAPPPIDPAPVFSSSEVSTIRQSLIDPDSAVRWAAVELLYNIHDPNLGKILDKMIAEDPDAELRIKIIGMMKGREGLVRLGGLVKGLGDTDQGVRIASLSALGEIGDPSVTTWVTALLRDPEPEVRVAALQTLGKFQEKRKAEFRALAEKLKKDYEGALRRAEARR
jgi:HEAT repeat protein